MSNFAGNTRSGEHSDSDEEEREPPATCESMPRTSGYTAKDGYATWTECLGFESINETVNCSDPMTETVSTASQTVEDAVGVESRSRARRITRKCLSSQRNDFPPLLSTLNRNGRPRYDFVKIRENGRLQIQMVPNERPELVAAVEPSGRLTLTFMNGKNQDGRDNDELEAGSIQDEESKV